MVAAIWHSLQSLYNFRVNSETLRYTKRSTLDPPLGTRWKATIAPLPSAAWSKTSQPALHQFFPSRKVTGIGTRPPAQLKQDPEMALFLFFSLANCLCNTSGWQFDSSAAQGNFGSCSWQTSRALPFPHKPAQTLAALCTTLLMHAGSSSS